MYYLPGNVISATVGLVYINLQPEYELPSLIRFEQFRKFGKIGLRGTVLPSDVHLKEKFLIGNRVLVHGNLTSDLTFIALLTSERFPEIGGP